MLVFTIDGVFFQEQRIATTAERRTMGAEELDDSDDIVRLSEGGHTDGLRLIDSSPIQAETPCERANKDRDFGTTSCRLERFRVVGI